jgi:outer membrane receptor protein involved in Fe transport
MRSSSRNRAAMAVLAASRTRSRAGASKIGLAVAAALASVVIPRAPALAAAPADASAAASGGLQEVTVTARKISENLQDVPMSIDVFTSQDLQKLAINGMDDYLQKVPSISYISTGPGTQLFVMRGVSDGSNPNYANTSSTGFFVDDMSMSDSGAQPDLILYDIERIEILNGPQGTTFGAGAMSGAIRYITNKPDVNKFSAGADLDAGKIQNGGQNWLYEGFLNVPLIEGKLGLRVSAFYDSQGGFIDNLLTTRTWVNTAVSNNSQWAGNDYNTEHVAGGRVALKGVFSDGWSAVLTAGYQKQHTFGAWDEDPNTPPRTVVRFGPEENTYETTMVDFRLDGDVGIGDLVFASTYWSQTRRQWNEYSQYMENFNAGAGVEPPYPAPPPYYPGYPGTQEGFTCQSDPFFGGTPFQGCAPPLQYYSYNIFPKRYSNELRLSSKAGGRFHWLAGLYWEKTVDKNFNNTYYMPGLNYTGAAAYYYGLGTPTLPPGVWYAYTESTSYLQTTEFTNISFDVTDKLNIEAGLVHFHSDSTYNTPYAQFAYYESGPSYYTTSSNKWNGKLGVNYHVTDRAMVYADWAQGFRDGGANYGDPQSCYTPDNGVPGVPPIYDPDTLNNYEVGWKATGTNNRWLWNGAAYYMDWKNMQALIYNALVCPSSSYNINVGDARIYGVESNVDFKLTDNLTFQAAINYTDAHVVSTDNPANQAYVGERLPFSPYFSWSFNVRYDRPLTGETRGYVQFDMAHKGDMYNGLNPNDVNTGLPRILQPSYSLMNLRFGLAAPSDKWLAELYVTNLADKNAIIYSNTGNFDLRLTTNQPRTYGLRLSYRWGAGS